MNKKLCFIFSILVGLSGPLWAASAGKYVKEGNRLYRKGAFDESLKEYEEALKADPENDIVNYNLGSLLYQKGDYPKSIEHSRKSLLSDNQQSQQNAHYNLGNALYKWGIAQKQKDISSAVKNLEEALSHYEQAIALNKDDKDAQFNYEFVKKELEKLKEQQKQDQNRDQNQDQRSQGSDKEDSKKDAKDSSQNGGEELKFSTEQGGKEESSLSKPKDQGAEESKELTPQEAQMLLKSYEATEEPKGLFNMQKEKRSLKEVERDW